jgi:hypothetical protein
MPPAMTFRGAITDMQRIVSISLSRRRLISVIALGAVLAAFLQIQAAGLRGVGVRAATGAAVTAAPGTVCTAAFIGFVSGLTLAPPGTTVYISPHATGCTSPEYRVLLLAPGSSTWVFKTAYNSSATYTWVTTGAPQGIWQVGVWFRQVGSGARYQSWSIRTFTLVVSYCIAAEMSAIPPVSLPGQYTITASSTGCYDPRYEWWTLAPGATTWVMAQSYAATQSQTFVWNWAAGGYRIGVWARQTGSTRRYDAYAMYTIWP